MLKPTAIEISAMAHEVIERAHRLNANDNCDNPDDWAYYGERLSMDALYMEAAAHFLIAATLQQRKVIADA